jgi:lipopolysaccharide transport system ATP-binding protein
MDVAARPLRAVPRVARRASALDGWGQHREFWALRDVSLDIKHGEVLGIIGRNGAGKSTLLKLLSQITEPTEGRIAIDGRVASLLEVGTGFHPELTGRENMFLNGAILGMSRAEIARKFDQIVAFAEVEKFIDTPVKRYSSGMYVRLAFAVAAHLEPEILVLDEVLAVGDAAFQSKCLGKMGDVAKAGRTVLFVSHNMGAVGTLCDRAIVMEHGSIAYQSRAADAIAHYTALVGHQMRASRDLRAWCNRAGSGQARILWGAVSWERGSLQPDYVTMGDTLTIRFDVERDRGIHPRDLRFSCVISTVTGIPVLHISNEDDAFSFPDIERGMVTVCLPRLTLFPGAYTVSLWVGSQHYDDYDYVKDCLGFEVVQGDTPSRAYRMSWHNGLAYHPSHWSIEVRTEQ